MRPRFTETFESYDRHCWENKRETFKRPREHQDASAPAASSVLSSARGFGAGSLHALPLKFKKNLRRLMLDDVKSCLFKATKNTTKIQQELSKKKSYLRDAPHQSVFTGFRDNFVIFKRVSAMSDRDSSLNISWSLVRLYSIVMN